MRALVTGRRSRARLAQLVERQPFKLVVVGSSPTVGALLQSCEFVSRLFCHTRRPAEGPHGVMDNALDF
jgi:hypothetical protein